MQSLLPFIEQIPVWARAVGDTVDALTLLALKAIGAWVIIVFVWGRRK